MIFVGSVDAAFNEIFFAKWSNDRMVYVTVCASLLLNRKMYEVWA